MTTVFRAIQILALAAATGGMAVLIAGAILVALEDHALRRAAHGRRRTPRFTTHRNTK